MPVKPVCHLCRGPLVPATDDKVRCQRCGALQPRPQTRSVVYRPMRTISQDTPWKKEVKE
jgi:tRNA(Ile2) C34 agmatinyltransferase TiaS